MIPITLFSQTLLAQIVRAIPQGVILSLGMGGDGAEANRQKEN